MAITFWDFLTNFVMFLYKCLIMFYNQGKSFIFRNVLYRGIIDQIVWLPAVVPAGPAGRSPPLVPLAWSGKGDVQTPFWRGYEED